MQFQLKVCRVIQIHKKLFPYAYLKYKYIILKATPVKDNTNYCKTHLKFELVIIIFIDRV